MSVPGSSFFSASTACRTASRWKCVEELITTASTPSRLAASAISATGVSGAEEVRGPAGHVEAVGHHAQAEVVPLLGRARQQHGAPGRLRPRPSPSGRPGYTISTMVRTVALARCSSQMAVLPVCHAAPVSARMRVSTSRYSAGIVDGAGRDRLDGGAHGRRLVVLGQGRRHGLVDGLTAGSSGGCSKLSSGALIGRLLPA